MFSYKKLVLTVPDWTYPHFCKPYAPCTRYMFQSIPTTAQQANGTPHPSAPPSTSTKVPPLPPRQSVAYRGNSPGPRVPGGISRSNPSLSTSPPTPPYHDLKSGSPVTRQRPPVTVRPPSTSSSDRNSVRSKSPGSSSTGSSSSLSDRSSTGAINADCYETPPPKSVGPPPIPQRQNSQNIPPIPSPRTKAAPLSFPLMENNGHENTNLWSTDTLSFEGFKITLL